MKSLTARWLKTPLIVIFWNLPDYLRPDKLGVGTSMMRKSGAFAHVKQEEISAELLNMLPFPLLLIDNDDQVCLAESGSRELFPEQYGLSCWSGC